MKTIIVMFILTIAVFANNYEEKARECVREFENEKRYSLSFETIESIKANFGKMENARKSREWGKFNNAKGNVFGYCPETIIKYYSSAKNVLVAKGLK